MTRVIFTHEISWNPPCSALKSTHVHPFLMVKLLKSGAWTAPQAPPRAKSTLGAEAIKVSCWWGRRCTSRLLWIKWMVLTCWKIHPIWRVIFWSWVKYLGVTKELMFQNRYGYGGYGYGHYSFEPLPYLFWRAIFCACIVMSTLTEPTTSGAVFFLVGWFSFRKRDLKPMVFGPNFLRNSCTCSLEFRDLWMFVPPFVDPLASATTEPGPRQQWLAHQWRTPLQVPGVRHASWQQVSC